MSSESGKMILVICGDGADPRLRGMDLAGLPFVQHLPTQWRSMDKSKVHRLDEKPAADDELERVEAVITSGEDVLVVDADVWMSATAMKQLYTIVGRGGAAMKVVARRASIAGEPHGRDVLAMFLPATLAGPYFRDIADRAPGLRSVRAAHDLVSGEEVDGLELDGAQPPVRIETLIDLTELDRSILRTRAYDAIRSGVRIRDPQNIEIRGELRCGAGVEIDIGVIIQGRATLGDGARIGAHAILANATIGARSTVHPYSIIEDSVIGADVFVGPYGRVRPGSVIGDFAQIGNFVEVKNSEIGAGSRINHLAFVGDATLGERVTLGAGTITCNHDGVGVQHTQIGAGAYVGSGSELIAPVTIGENATIAAGSTITADAPADALTIARARQVTIPGWTPRSREPDAR